MESMCRMCGPKNSSGDLIALLSTECNNVSLKFLFEMFTHVKFEDNPVLPQSVCETCRVTLFKFIEFSRIVEETQKTFKKLPAIKGENASRGVVIQKGRKKTARVEKCGTSKPTEESDNYSSCNGDAYSSDLRQVIADCQLIECSVQLERLPLIYVQTSSESESSETESEDETLNNKKRRLNSSTEKSPNKRMRLGPLSPASKAAEVRTHRPFNYSSHLHLKSEAEEKRATIIFTTTDMQKYDAIFEKELSEDIRQSSCNLSVPECAKQFDGQVKDDYSNLFKSWSDIVVQCQVKGCNKKFDPYNMNRHMEDHHQLNGGTFKCSLVGCSEKHSFVDFLQHVVDKHHSYLSFR